MNFVADLYDQRHTQHDALMLIVNDRDHLMADYCRSLDIVDVDLHFGCRFANHAVAVEAAHDDPD